MIQWVVMEVMYVGEGEHYYRAVWHKLSCKGSRTSVSSRSTLGQMTQVELLTERYLGEGEWYYEQMTTGELWMLEWKLGIKL